jgi:hypothetical protein
VHALLSTTARTKRSQRALRDPHVDQCDYYNFLPNMLMMFVVTLTCAPDAASPPPAPTGAAAPPPSL